jgi:heme A synthase
LRNPWLHRYAILLAGLVFLLLAAGAYLTSNIRPMPGPNPGPLVRAPGLQQIHLILAGLVALLTLGLAFWMRSLPGWIALATVILEGLSGSSLGNVGTIFHAIFAPILFSSVVAAAVITSESWSRPAVPVKDLWPPLRTMAILAPVLVVIQISLGAGFRHNSMGVAWHILNAGIVLLLIMVLGVCLLRQYPEHPAHRPAAITLLVITGVQVLLGFGVFLVILIVSENNQSLIFSGMAHVLTGSLVLAATVVLALELRRSDRSQTGH